MVSKRSIKLSGHATSISLEDEFWDELKRLATLRSMSMAKLVEEIDGTREGNLSSALRLYVLKSLKDEA
ncbi:MAG: ribbon-helix-helix domain-containing protein [Sphingomonadales bacterium]|nr:ribbon-helix-helix domain-containing protein [Sphingomonadales bacterium]